MLLDTTLQSQDVWKHAENFNWVPQSYYPFVHKLADNHISTKMLEDQFGHMSYRHQRDNAAKGPWQSDQRVFFHSTMIQKRIKNFLTHTIPDTQFYNKTLRTAATGSKHFHGYAVAKDNPVLEPMVDLFKSKSVKPGISNNII